MLTDHNENIDATTWAKKELAKVTFGEILRDLRECDGINQTDLAKKIGVSKQFLSDVERNRKIVSIAFAKKIATIMGYAVEPLIEIIIRDELLKNDLSYDIELKIKKNAA
ncbi:MAG: helix-turn-helix transcriptional regulator [Bdellovibrionota bacterium]